MKLFFQETHKIISKTTVMVGIGSRRVIIGSKFSLQNYCCTFAEQDNYL